MSKNLAMSNGSQFNSDIYFGWVWLQIIGCEAVAQKCQFMYSNLATVFVQGHVVTFAECLKLLLLFLDCDCRCPESLQIIMSSIKVSTYSILSNIS